MRSKLNTMQAKETIYSVIRLLISVVGSGIFLSNFEWGAQLLEALLYIENNIDVVFSSLRAIVGFGLTVWGFFFDPARGTAITLFTSSRRFGDRAYALNYKKK